MLVHMGSERPPTSSDVLLGRLRTFLLALVVFGMVGTAADLLLLGHYEDALQLPPLALIVVGLAVAIWAWMSRSAGAVMAMRVTMVLFLVTGAAGVVLHYEGNSEFQREMDPSIDGWPLAVKAIRAKAPPALAPAAMIQIGLLGLLYTYRHGALVRRDPSTTREHMA